MDNFFENPIARMYGPEFLMLYLVLFIVIGVYLRFGSHKISFINDQREIPKLSENPDVYEVAYLRGKELEVLSLAMYTLVKRNYFELLTNDQQSGARIRKKQGHKEISALNLLEKSVFNALNGKTILSDFSLKVLKDEMFKEQCAIIQRNLNDKKITVPTISVGGFSIVKTILMVSLIALGFYKYQAAIAHGHRNVGFLMFIAVVGSFVLAYIKPSDGTNSDRNKFLTQLKEIFKPIQGELLFKQPIYLQQLLLAIYGFGLLEHSSLFNFYKYLTENLNAKTSFWNNDGGSTSSCSSSGCGSSCGGGCGGGCGGCS